MSARVEYRCRQGADHGGKACPLSDRIEHAHRFRKLDNLQECGSCGCYHRPRFAGDCRNDAERFPDWQGQYRCACGARQDRTETPPRIVTRGAISDARWRFL